MMNLLSLIAVVCFFMCIAQYFFIKWTDGRKDPIIHKNDDYLNRDYTQLNVIKDKVEK